MRRFLCPLLRLLLAVLMAPQRGGPCPLPRLGERRWFRDRVLTWRGVAWAFALLALLSLAFAPAPLSRGKRKADDEYVPPRIVGVWRDGRGNVLDVRADYSVTLTRPGGGVARGAWEHQFGASQRLKFPATFADPDVFELDLFVDENRQGSEVLRGHCTLGVDCFERVSR